MTRTIVLAVIALAGCTTAKQVQLPDGTRGYVIDQCSDLAACYQKSAEVCGGGKYEVLDQADRVEGAGGIVTTSYTMTIRCESEAQ